MPAEGYAATELAVENGGSGTVVLELDSLDFAHLCLPGFTDAPAEIGEVKGGESFSLFVGVCGYDAAAGERDLQISGQIVISDADSGEQVSVDWTFTPTRSGER